MIESFIRPAPDSSEPRTNPVEVPVHMWESHEPTEDSVGVVFDDLIESSITNEALSICESNIRSGPVALIIHLN
ncbi:unnamed protein product [Prunus armeniaca]